VPAAHEFLDQDPVSGRYPYLGFVVAVNGCTVYHAGDTCLYEGIHERLRRVRPDVMILPINGRDARRLAAGCIGNMTYQEAADLAGGLAPGVVIPAHYDMFATNAGDVAAFSAYVRVKYPHQRVLVPSHGERVLIQ
jgi:L-ascorbate 6-phosphate lactonase